MDIRHPVTFKDHKEYCSKRSRLYRLYVGPKFDITKVDLMWRMAFGGLKTGDIIRKYKIPGAKVNCVFCNGKVLDTVEHLTVDCKALHSIRDIAIEYYTLFDLKVPLSDCDAMRLLLTLGLTPMAESDIRLVIILMLHQDIVTPYSELEMI